MTIDLNADVGEAESPSGRAREALLIPLVSSINVACGGHAGGESSMRAALRTAREHGVAAGAHPGFEDRENFGRLERPVSPEDVEALVVRQVRRLIQLAHDEGIPLRHVKPHGALYNQAARSAALASAVARGIAAVDATLAFVGLAGTVMESAAAEAGLASVPEGFADRSYESDGTLTPRHIPGAVHEDPSTVVSQALALVREGAVLSRQGVRVVVRARTICLHGDTDGAVEFARRVRAALAGAGVIVAAPDAPA